MKKMPPSAAFLLSTTITLGGLFLFWYGTEQPSPTQEWMLTFSAIIVFAGICINLAFYRCPHCGRHLGRVWPGGYCTHCGKKTEGD